MFYRRTENGNLALCRAKVEDTYIHPMLWKFSSWVDVVNFYRVYPDQIFSGFLPVVDSAKLLFIPFTYSKKYSLFIFVLFVESFFPRVRNDASSLINQNIIIVFMTSETSVHALMIFDVKHLSSLIRLLRVYSLYSVGFLLLSFLSHKLIISAVFQDFPLCFKFLSLQILLLAIFCWVNVVFEHCHCCFLCCQYCGSLKVMTGNFFECWVSRFLFYIH